MVTPLVNVLFGSMAILMAMVSSTETGSVIEVAGLKAYASGYPHSKSAVILASDIFGYEIPNLRTIADKVAAAGIYAVVPDFFHGDAYPKDASRNKTEWLESHPPEGEVKDAIAVLKAIKSKYTSSVGAAGFCWGGKLVAEVAKTHSIEAAVLLHPSYVTEDDIKEDYVPLAILAAELDKGTPAAQLKEFEEILTSKKVDNEIKIYPGVKHGWTLKYELNDTKAVEAAAEAHHDMIQWFLKNLD